MKYVDNTFNLSIKLFKVIRLKDRIKYLFCVLIGLSSALIEGYSVQSVFASKNVTLGVFLMLISAVLRLLNLVLVATLSKNVGNYLSTLVYRSMMSDARNLITAHTTSKLTTSLIFMVDTVGYSCLSSSILLITSVVSIITISTALIWGGGYLFGVSLASIAIYFYGTTIVSKKRLETNSKLAKSKREDLLKTINNTFMDVRRLYLDNIMPLYEKKYNLDDQSLRKVQAQNMIITSFPRLGFEIFLWAIGIIYLWSASTNNLTTDSLIATGFGLFRILPSFQQAVNSIGLLRAGKQAMVDVLNWTKLHIIDLGSKTRFDQKNDFTFSGIKSLDIRDMTTEHILNSLNISIKRNEPLLITGPSGSGKSTLIDSIIGFLPINTGSISISDEHGEYKIRDPLYKYLDISYAPQLAPLLDGSLYFNITVNSLQNKFLYHELLNKLGLGQLESREALSSELSNVSGGQQKRLSIARALYKKADLYIFDEPVSGLDEINSNSVCSLIVKQCQRYPCIIVTHSPKVVEAISSLSATHINLKINKTIT